MPSWGNARDAQRRLNRLGSLVEELTERLALAEEVVEAVQQDAHFRLDAMEAAA